VRAKPTFPGTQDKNITDDRINGKMIVNKDGNTYQVSKIQIDFKSEEEFRKNFTSISNGGIIDITYGSLYMRASSKDIDPICWSNICFVNNSNFFQDKSWIEVLVTASKPSH
jgi:hypothetical protein